MLSVVEVVSALIVADLHLRGHSRLWTTQSDMQKDLRSLVNELEIHQQVHRGNLNRLSSLMMRHWPELDSLMSLSTLSVLTLLAEYGSPANIVRHVEEAEQWVLPSNSVYYIALILLYYFFGFLKV